MMENTTLYKSGCISDIGESFGGMEQANTVIGVTQLFILAFYGFLKLKKRLQSNETRVAQLEKKLRVRRQGTIDI